MLNRLSVSKQISSDQDLFQIELAKAPQLSELLFNQFTSRISWITVISILVTIHYWFTYLSKQLNWLLGLILSFVFNLVIHLFITSFYAQFRVDPNREHLDCKLESGNELLKENRTIKHKEWLNRFLNELWPSICSNYKMEFLDQGIPIGKLLSLNKFNLTKTQTPKIEQINLVNKLNTSNGEIIILDLIALINWSTMDMDNLVSISISNLQFTISNLHAIKAKLRIRICLHYLNRSQDNKLYKLNLTILEQPKIMNYQTSGAIYLLYIFNLHLKFIYWLIGSFLLYPHTLVFILDKNLFDLDFLAGKLKNESFYLDLDDLMCLSLENGFSMFDDLIKDNLGEVDEVLTVYKDLNWDDDEFTRTKSSKSIKQLIEKEIRQENGKLNQFQESLKDYMTNKIAKHLIHITLMHCFNIPLPKTITSINNLSYFVTIQIGTCNLITNSHQSQEAIVYWMESFMLASLKLNLPVHLKILVQQNESKAEEIKRKTIKSNEVVNNLDFKDPLDDSAIRKDQLDEKPNFKIKECISIKLTDNLEQFLNQQNLNGRLYTAEDEHSKCRLTIRFSVFNFKLTKSISLANNYLISNLPVACLSLFVNHISGIEFINSLDKNNLDKYCWLSIQSTSQSYLFKSLNAGIEQEFKKSCFVILFNPFIERIQFKLYSILVRSSKEAKYDLQKTEFTTEFATAFPAKLTTTLNQPVHLVNQEIKSNNNYQLLAYTNLNLNFNQTKPEYKKVKLNGLFKNSHLHLYQCYSEIKNLELLKRIMTNAN